MTIPVTSTTHLALIFLLPGLIAILIGICNEISAASAAKNARKAAADEARRRAVEKAEETARKKSEAEKKAAEKKRIAAEKVAAREAERERIAQQRHENAMKRAEEMHALRLRQANELKNVRAENKPAVNQTENAAAKDEPPAASTPKTIEKQKANASKPFEGEFVSFTGICPKLERRAMIAHTNRLGGHGYETINTRCTLLVIGEKPGKNQLERAAKWNVKQITWQEWYKRAFGEAALPAPQAAKGMTLDEFANTLNAA